MHRLAGRSPEWSALQQRLGDRGPFGVERTGLDRAPGTPIPVGGIAEVALAPMQVRVNPRAIRVGDLLRDRVRSGPVAAGVVPERRQGLREIRRGIGR